MGHEQPPESKGNRVNIPDPVHGDWCVSGLGNLGESSEKSSLSFVRSASTPPRNRLVRR
ncbi:unnamed protein product [Schistosoma mansoni]|uniref:Smp_204860 n=1 Tax=Schistosoma mansoni TaxID=6183 RepID=G4M011_SCHMA|nr:unnamed protein product [Schistosoma mansoni]|eukprot:XP_018646829.1 unnamed protein product [Schistosoma mansoni]